jgi:hypothetical protein
VPVVVDSLGKVAGGDDAKAAHLGEYPAFFLSQRHTHDLLRDRLPACALIHRAVVGDGVLPGFAGPFGTPREVAAGMGNLQHAAVLGAAREVFSPPFDW